MIHREDPLHDLFDPIGGDLPFGLAPEFVHNLLVGERVVGVAVGVIEALPDRPAILGFDLDGVRDAVGVF